MRNAVPGAIDQTNYHDFVTSRELCVLHCDADWDVGGRSIARNVVAAAEREFGHDVSFGEMNVDQNVQLSRSLGICNVPTIAYFRAGRIVAVLVGADQNVSERIRRMARGEPIGRRDGTGPASNV